MNDLAPEVLCTKFSQRVNVTKTRNSKLLQIPLLKTATGQRSFKYRTVKLWNYLDVAIKALPSLKNFKNEH